jgi:ectoine hydroxylase-related dioxygenase (phytanoyl-CoA dioxygenase family)
MKDSFYGRIEQTEVNDSIACHAEEIAVRGFTVIPDLFSATELATWREKIDYVYGQQETEFGRENLIAIQELNLCRAPLLYDFEFIKLATHPIVLSVVKRFLGDWFILNLQNAIINHPHQPHHQSSWHRDLPYQNWVISHPIAINALLAIDEFSGITGGTHVVPFTHKTEILPSDAYIDANRVVASAPAGSAIVFDTMLFHRAGSNTSANIRRAVNHLYTTPILKQQYDFPRALGEQAELDPAIARLLGFTSQVPIDVRSWREARAAKILGIQ